MLKLDPYINVDPGTMSPFQHGEVFVTEDGAETDLDLGHYERFIRKMTKMKPQQLHHRPHLRRSAPQGASWRLSGRHHPGHPAHHRRDQASRCRLAPMPKPTSPWSKSAARWATSNRNRFWKPSGRCGHLGSQRALFMHLTLVPYIADAGETKTKPTQHSVKELRSIGIQPDMLICRSDHEIPESSRRKIALFTNVDLPAVVSLPDTDTIYRVPSLLRARAWMTRCCASST
jgi:CTP synthase